MEFEEWRTGEGRWVKGWRCCGMVWQLVMSRLYPGRERWRPECPACKGKLQFSPSGKGVV